MNTPAARSPAPAHEALATSSLASTIALHLIPGTVFAAVFIAVAAPLREAGMPPIGSFVLIAVLVLIPLELGYLLFRGRQRNGHLSLAGVVVNREPLSLRSYALWIPALFIVSFALFTVVGMVTTDWIKEGFFAWVPAWQSDPFGLQEPSRYGSTTILITWVAAAAINGIAAPFVEELYFRGHLLPRLSRLGAWGPAVNAVLFALYHFVSPWQFFARALGLMPLFYFVWRRRNIYLAVAVHCGLNTLGSLLLLPQVLNLP